MFQFKPTYTAKPKPLKFGAHIISNNGSFFIVEGCYGYGEGDHPYFLGCEYLPCKRLSEEEEALRGYVHLNIVRPPEGRFYLIEPSLKLKSLGETEFMVLAESFEQATDLGLDSRTEYLRGVYEAALDRLYDDDEEDDPEE